jgi:hypothetical protein
MPTHFEFQATLRAYSARCEGIAARRMAEGDKLAAVDFLIEAIAAIEISKMVVLMPLEMVPGFLHSLSPNSSLARAARRKALRQPRRATAQGLLRFALNRAAKRRTQASNNESTPRP